MMRAAIYCRISQDRTGAGLGVQRQEDDCRLLAGRLGWEVADRVYVDNDVSAYTGKPRGAYLRLLADIEAGRVDAVLCWHTDRLHRSPVELERYVAICEARSVPTQTATSGLLDLATPSGRMTARILSAVARLEVEQKGERTRRAQRQATELGRWLGGARPFGWTLDPPTLHPVEADLVREASARILAGGSLGSVATQWNNAGVTSTHGRRWSATTVKQVLLRARNAGLATWHNEVVAVSTFPAIVEETVWRGVVAVLTDPSRARTTATTARWLLAGIAQCECGRSLRSASVRSRKGEKVPTYRCPGKGPGHVYIAAALADRFVTDVIGGVLAHHVIRTSEPGRPDAGVQAAALRARLDEAADAYADGAITSAQLTRITSRLRSDLEAIDGRLAAEAAAGAMTAFVGMDGAARWLAADLDTQRAVLRRIALVTVRRSAPGAPRRFDSRRIEVTAVTR